VSGGASRERILRDTPHTISYQPYGADGVAQTPSSGTVMVTTEGGDILVNAAAVTMVGTLATYALTVTHTADVKRITAAWSLVIGGVTQEFTTTYEIVDELLFTEVEARAFDNNTLLDAAVYPDAKLIQGRDRIHDAFERILRAGIGTRYARQVFNGTGTRELDLQKVCVTAIQSVKERAVGTQTWTAYTSAELADIFIEAGGLLVRETLGQFTSGRLNVAVEYEHGLRPIPDDLRRAALWVLRYELVPSNIDRRTTTLVDQMGTFTLATPGQRGSWYGLPEVDIVLNHYRGRYNVPAIA